VNPDTPSIRDRPKSVRHASPLSLMSTLLYGIVRNTHDGFSLGTNPFNISMYYGDVV
jgi:hypothetical protein